MGFIVFISALVVSSMALSSAGGGLIFAVLSYFLFKQSKILYTLGKRISALEEQHKHLPAAHPTPETAVTTTKVAAESTTQSIPKTNPTMEPTPVAVYKPDSIMPPKPQPKSATPSKPQKTMQESLENVFGSAIAKFLVQGNPIARIGALILFFGVGFALKFAADEGFFSPELRLILAALLSIGLLILGWRMRHNRGQFALTLQGAGLGIFYITSFIAYKMYGFIPSSLAFTFFLLITVLSGMLAILSNARSIGLLAIIGGFLAPILASDGGGNHIALFSYLTLLNLAIFAMCWFKSWRSLNLTGFFFTFLISVLWAQKSYRPELYWSCQPFLILFAAIYTFINCAYSIKKSEGSKHVIDPLMTFSTPLLYSLLQAKLVQPFEYGVAISAAIFGAAHIVLARALFHFYTAKLRHLVESYLIIGLVLLTLAVPFAFDGRVSSALWALEATALIWSGIRQKSLFIRVLGLILLPLASLLFLSESTPYTRDIAFLNQYFIGICMLCAGHLISAALLIRAPVGAVNSDEKQIGIAALWCAALWWSGGGWFEITRHLQPWHEWFFEVFQSAVWINAASFNPSMYSLFTSISVLAFWAIFKRFKLPGRGLIQRVLIPVHYWLLIGFSIDRLVSLFSYAPEGGNLFAILGIVSWPLLFIVHYYILHDEEKLDQKYSAPLQHRLGVWLFIYIATWELCWIAQYFASPGWRQAALTFAPALCALLLSAQIRTAKKWPFTLHSSLYCAALSLPVWFSMGSSYLYDFISESTAPLPYIPLLNALDVAQGASALALITWITRMSKLGIFSESKRRVAYSLLGCWSFVWATATLLRVIHHAIGTPWTFYHLYGSNFVQAAVSIFWSILALSLMMLSHQKGWRQLWKIGAILIGVVVVKLFLIDLSNHATVGRIAAFLGVGILMLGIGYLAPIPPEKTTNLEKEEI
jgi:uncharacterized membrane protein